MKHALPILLLLAGPAAAQVPIMAPAPMSGTLTLETPSGPRDYQVDEMSVSVTRSLDARGDSKADVSVSIGAIRPLDPALLDWLKQGSAGPASSARVVVSFNAPIPSGTGAPMRYEMDGAKVQAFSASHSASAGTVQVALQVLVLRIALNGVVLN